MGIGSNFSPAMPPLPPPSPSDIRQAGSLSVPAPLRRRRAIKITEKTEPKNKITFLGRQYENTVSGNELLPEPPASLQLFTDCFAKQSGRHLGTADGLCIYSCHLTETNS